VTVLTPTPHRLSHSATQLRAQLDAIERVRAFRFEEDDTFIAEVARMVGFDEGSANDWKGCAL